MSILLEYITYLKYFEYGAQYNFHTGKEYYTITIEEKKHTEWNFKYETTTVDINISRLEEKLIEANLESFGNAELMAKSAFLEALYSIQSENIIFFLRTSIAEFTTLMSSLTKLKDVIDKASIISHEQLLAPEIILNYVESCVNYGVSWLLFLQSTLNNYKTRSNEDQKSVVGLDKSITALLAKLRESRFELIKQQTRVGLKDYLKDHVIFKWLINQTEIIPLIDRFGYAKRGVGNNKQKQELSSLLFFLRDNDFLQGDYSKDKDLYELGKILFDISPSLMSKSEGKRTSIFKPILEKLKR